MIRFKVVRASRVLLVLAAIALALAVGFVVWQSQRAVPPEERAAATLIQLNEVDEAKTQAVFASGASPVLPEEEAEVRPRVLIYHTHTHEAYEQVSDDPYEAVETWRTTDERHSVVRVGEALADALDRLGFEVVHDTTDHEGSELSTAYDRSLRTLMSYADPFDLYIDLHRDAWSSGMALRYTDDNGTAYAQPMLLIGNGKGFDEKPSYARNHAFAKRLSERINRLKPGLCRPVLVKDGRYNQHIGVFSVLIEVGHNRNTLAEALNTAPVIADALRSMMIDSPDPTLERMKRSG